MVARAGLRRWQALDVLNHLLLTLIGLACLYPLAHVLSISLSSERAIVQGITWFPRDVDLISYKFMLTHPRILGGYANTILYTVTGTSISVAMTAITAYPLSKRRLFGRTPITFMMVLTLYFTGGLIPTYLLVRGLGLLNTMWALVLPPAVAVWNLIILRTFFQHLPEELEEAACIDGAGVLRTLRTVILPLSKAALATIGLFYAIGLWNQYFPPLVYLRDIDKMPLQIIVRDMVFGDVMRQRSIANNNPFAEELLDMSIMLQLEKLKWTALFVSIVPMLLVYPFIQRYFAKGVIIGALK